MRVNFLMNGKKLTLYPYIRRKQTESKKTIGQSLYSLFAAKFLSVSLITKCLAFLLRAISPNQSGFRPGDSCIKQFLAITHEIYKLFDKGFQVRGFSLDISKLSIRYGMKAYFSN